MADKLKVLNELNFKDDLFNHLVDETTKLMKVEIIQSIMNRADRRKVEKVVRYKGLDKKIKLKTNKQTYSKVNLDKYVKNEMKMDHTVSVGDVAANRFARKSDLKQKEIVKNIQNLEKIDSETFVSIQAKEYAVLDGPPVIQQVHLEETFPRLVQKKYFKQLIEEPLMLDAEVYGPTILVPARERAARFQGYDRNTGEKIFEETDAERRQREERAAERREEEQRAAEEREAERRAAEQAIKKIELKLHRVKCIDETGGNWLTELGSDEISLGGVTLDNNGLTQKIREFKVGHFDDGTIKSYDPPRVLRTFSGEGRDYPKNFSAFISLAEKDSEGFSSFIEDLYEAIRDELDAIIRALAVAAGVALGSSIGGTIGVIAGPLGALIGAAAGAILGALVAWFVNVLKDDIFTPKTSLLSLALDNPGAGTVEHSPISRLTYKEHDAHYQVDLSWTVKY